MWLQNKTQTNFGSCRQKTKVNKYIPNKYTWKVFLKLSFGKFNNHIQFPQSLSKNIATGDLRTVEAP